MQRFMFLLCMLNFSTLMLGVCLNSTRDIPMSAVKTTMLIDGGSVEDHDCSLHDPDKWHTYTLLKTVEKYND